MRYDDQNLREMLAAEYVLGTLRGAARRRYERLQIARPDWQQATAWWAGRIHLLAETAPAVEPPAKVWRGIEARLYGGRQAAAVRWWRAFALSSSGLAVALAFLLGSNLMREPAIPVVVTEPATVAILNNEEAKPAWMLSLSRNADGSSAIRVVTLPGVVPVAGKSFELWVLPADKSPPVSLGLLPVEGNGLLRVAGELAPAIENGGLAVSLEPEGGSPTGQPTGAVLYQGRLIQI